MRDTDYLNGIVKIVDDTGSSLGTGFLVGKNGYLLTAAHVLAGPSDNISPDALPDHVLFEFLTDFGSENCPYKKAKVIKSLFFPFSQGDIAVLQYEGPLTEQNIPLSLGAYQNKTGNDGIRLYGFPEYLPEGDWGKGNLLGEKPDRTWGEFLIQFSSDDVVRGFSGSPAWSVATGQVLGVTSWVGLYPTGAPNGKAHLIPTSRIKELLREHPYVLEKGGSADIAIHEKAIYYEPVERLYEQKYEISNLQFDTIACICKIQQFASVTTSIKFLVEKLGLTQIAQYLPGNSNAEHFWLGVVNYLQYAKIEELIRLLGELEFFSDGETIKKLIQRWQKIAENPYHTIFEPYVEKILGNNEYLDINRKYVELLGQLSTNINIIEQTAIEQKGFSTHRLREKDYEEYQEAGEKGRKKGSGNSRQQGGAREDIRIEPILNIARDEERFVIIGKPGSGKTATMHKILMNNAEHNQKGDPRFKIPIFIRANQYNLTTKFEHLIAKAAPFWLNPEVDKSKFRILVDGINEINPAFQDAARRELRALLDENEGTSFIISTRKYGFENVFDLPLFELKELQPPEIKEYIKSYRPKDQTAIWNAIHEPHNQHLLEMAANPQTLLMIVTAYDEKQAKIMPENRGGVYREFVRKLLDRDNNNNLNKSQLDYATKEALMSKLALKMRLNEFNLPRREVLELFAEDLGNDIDKSKKFIDDLCNSYLIRISEKKEEFVVIDQTYEAAGDNSTVAFIHETYLEYFCALEIKNNFIVNKAIEIDFNRTEWFETLMLASDLFDNSGNLIDYINYLFFGGQPHEIYLETKSLEPIKANGRFLFRAKRINYRRTFHNNYYTNFAIACKIAFNIKTIYPIAFAHTEHLLYKECIGWLDAASRAYVKWLEKMAKKEKKENYDQFEAQNEYPDYEPYPVSQLLAAIAGLSSPNFLEAIFLDEDFQAAWLVYDGKEEHKREGNLEIFVANISNYALFYDYVIEKNCNTCGNRTLLDGCEISLGLLREQIKAKMPLQLQKRLFEQKPLLDLLRRIGKQDPDYYIENFGLTEGKDDDFITYLVSFSSNSKVQKELLKFLHSDRDEVLRTKVFRQLMERYYCVEDVVAYINEHLERYLDTEHIQYVRDYIYSLPKRVVPPTLYERITSCFEIVTTDLEMLRQSFNQRVFIGQKNGDLNLFQFVANKQHLNLLSVSALFPFDASLHRLIDNEGILYVEGIPYSYNYVKKNKNTYRINLTNKSELNRLSKHAIIDGLTYRLFYIGSNNLSMDIDRIPIAGTARINGSVTDFFGGDENPASNTAQISFHGIEAENSNPIEIEINGRTFKGNIISAKPIQEAQKSWELISTDKQFDNELEDIRFVEPAHLPTHIVYERVVPIIMAYKKNKDIFKIVKPSNIIHQFIDNVD